MSIKKSFSLIEVLIFVTILSLFLVIAAAIITTSMRQNTMKINMLKANHYNEQLLDWVRNEKGVLNDTASSWAEFAKRGSKLGTTYCFNKDVLDWNSAVPKESCAYSLGGLFRRYATATTDDDTLPTQVIFEIHSDWQEAGNIYTSKLDTIFSIWE